MVNVADVKFLIDECLSLKLEDMAVKFGYAESKHVNHLGMQGCSDPEITRRAIAEDWTLVTCNGKDFRPESGSKSTRPCYVGIELHAGLICLNLHRGAKIGHHSQYFRAALDKIRILDSLVNRTVEVSPDPGNPRNLIVKDVDFPKES